jgi:hypothetical protein
MHKKKKKKKLQVQTCAWNLKFQTSYALENIMKHVEKTFKT